MALSDINIRSLERLLNGGISGKYVLWGVGMAIADLAARCSSVAFINVGMFSGTVYLHVSCLPRSSYAYMRGTHAELLFSRTNCSTEHQYPAYKRKERMVHMMDHFTQCMGRSSLKR